MPAGTDFDADRQQQRRQANGGDTRRPVPSIAVAELAASSRTGADARVARCLN